MRRTRRGISQDTGAEGSRGRRAGRAALLRQHTPPALALSFAKSRAACSALSASTWHGVKAGGCAVILCATL